MGSKTRDQIVSEALQLAGNTGLSIRGREWLQLWLDRTYQSYPWPFLTMTVDLPLPAGVTFLPLNDPDVLRLTDVTGVKLLTAAGEFIRDLPITPWQTRGGLKGAPSNVIYEQDDDDVYQANLLLDKVPEIPYKLSVKCQYLPAALAAADRPRYRQDETLVHAVFVAALRHQNEKDARWMAEAETLRRMLAEDRVAESKRGGSPATLALSTRFRR